MFTLTWTSQPDCPITRRGALVGDAEAIWYAWWHLKNNPQIRIEIRDCFGGGLIDPKKGIRMAYAQPEEK